MVQGSLLIVEARIEVGRCREERQRQRRCRVEVERCERVEVERCELVGIEQRIERQWIEWIERRLEWFGWRLGLGIRWLGLGIRWLGFGIERRWLGIRWLGFGIERRWLGLGIWNQRRWHERWQQRYEGCGRRVVVGVRAAAACRGGVRPGAGMS